MNKFEKLRYYVSILGLKVSNRHSKCQYHVDTFMFHFFGHLFFVVNVTDSDYTIITPLIGFEHD